MLDPAISAFFVERKEGWLKGKLKASMSESEVKEIELECETRFALSQWLPDAAKRAGQISLSTHPCTFSHPSARKNKNGDVSATIANAQARNDGFLRTGNLIVESDALGNAAALDVYKFLTLEMQDKQTLLQHIQADTSLSKKLLGEGDGEYQTLRSGFLAMAATDETAITSSKIKQVYFPLFEYDGLKRNTDYHLLSLLTPSGLVFELRRRVDALRFSERTKLIREYKRKNEFSEESYQEIYGLTTIGFGGTKPQNISVLNNQNAGKSHLLLSLPPVINKREIRIPTQNFFKQTINPWRLKECYEAFHGLINLPQEKRNSHFVEYRDNRIQEYIDYILNMMWEVRRLFEQSDGLLPESLPEHQKIWLFPDKQELRENSDEWLQKIIFEIAQQFLYGYQKVIRSKALTLSDRETEAIASVVAKNKELLR